MRTPKHAASRDTPIVIAITVWAFALLGETIWCAPRVWPDTLVPLLVMGATLLAGPPLLYLIADWEDRR